MTSDFLDFDDPAVSEPVRTEADFKGSFPYRPTLFVGLGGTGGHAVAKIKELFSSYVLPQQPTAGLGGASSLNPLYAFLAFDTDQQACPQALARNQEWFHLGVGDLAGFYRGLGADPFFKDWLVPNFPAPAIADGASGYRNLGRLALMANLTTVQQKIEEKKTQITTAATSSQTVNPTPVVYVFTSVSGGTGSGMTLDLCFLFRRLFPSETGVYGFVAVLDGLPNLPPRKRRELRINTYAALRELNAFMSGTAEGVGQRGEVRYPFGVIGNVREPFDECYLLGSHRSDGALSLPSHEHVTSFMARFGFMMTAFSFKAAGGSSPDYAGIMNNWRTDLTHGAELGVRMAFCVPGMAQAHFPFHEVSDLLAYELARNVARHLSSGDLADDAIASALVKNRISFDTLREIVSRRPGCKSGEPLGPRDYDADVAVLKDAKTRYRNAADLLALGDSLPAKRMAAVEAALAPNVQAAFDSIWPGVVEKVRELFADERHRGVGALDFLEDFSREVQLQRSLLRDEGRRSVDPEFDGISSQWASLKPRVTDCVTKGGAIDSLADSFRADGVALLYATFLNEADVVVVKKARNVMTDRVLARLEEEAGRLSKKLRQLVSSDLPASVAALEKKIQTLQTALFREETGQSESVADICSTNVLDGAWREGWTAQNTPTVPATVAAMTRDGWNPLDLADLPGSAARPASLDIARDLASRVSPLFEAVRKLTPSALFEKGDAGTGPASGLAVSYFRQLQPQMRLSGMRNHLRTAPSTLIFCGGLDAPTREILKDQNVFGGATLHVSDNQETNRINFFSTTLPVAMAGCDLVRDVLEPEYQSWEREVAGLSPPKQVPLRRLFSCFPGSDEWLAPTAHRGVVDVHKVAFARALAVSLLFPQVEIDNVRMRSASGNTPAQLAYGLFFVERSGFWLWPFFAALDPATVITAKPVRLGTNLVQAIDAFSAQGDNASLEAAQQWVKDFEDRLAAQLSEPQLKAAVASFRARIEAWIGKAKDDPTKTAWREILQIVSEWDALS